MATKKNMQLGEGFKNLQKQFQNLDPKDPSLWPAAPRWMLLAVIAALVVGLGWYLYLSNFDEELTTSQGKELQLKEDYKSRLRSGPNVSAAQRATAAVPTMSTCTARGAMVSGAAAGVASSVEA